MSLAKLTSTKSHEAGGGCIAWSLEQDEISTTEQNAIAQKTDNLIEKCGINAELKKDKNARGSKIENNLLFTQKLLFLPPSKIKRNGTS